MTEANDKEVYTNGKKKPLDDDDGIATVNLIHKAKFVQVAMIAIHH